MYLESQWLKILGYSKPRMGSTLGSIVACDFQLLGCPGKDSKGLLRARPGMPQKVLTLGLRILPQQRLWGPSALESQGTYSFVGLYPLLVGGSNPQKRCAVEATGMRQVQRSSTETGLGEKSLAHWLEP